MSDATNDNEAKRRSVEFANAAGAAALLLVESLIHRLLAKSDLSVTEAMEIVQSAIDVDAEISAEGAAAKCLNVNSLLSKMLQSISIDYK